jgi:hypothetical protein
VALSKNDALIATRSIIAGARAAEAPRLERIANALRPWAPGRPPSFVIPTDAPKSMVALAGKSETNFLPLVAETFSQVMKVDGYYQSGQSERAAAWAFWQRNRLDAKQTGVVRSALHYGAAYTTVLPGDKAPVVRGYSPRRMTAVYEDPSEDEFPMMALDIDGSMMKLYDEDQVYYIGVENLPRGTFLTECAGLLGARFDFIEARAHNVGVCPVVRFRDRMLLDGEEQYGIVEPLLTLQDRINETTFGMMVNQFFAAFKQRYVIGWVPESESQEMRAAATDTWYFDDEDVKVGQFDQSGPEGYIKSKASALQDLSAISQVPAQNLGVDGISNISAETLAALEAGKERKADEITTSLGESWEQMFRLGAHISGDTEGAEDYGSEVRWKDATARSFAQTVDGLGKLATMLHIPDELLWEQIPGWSDGTVERAKEMRLKADSITQLQMFLDSQTGGSNGGSVPASN